MIKALFFDLDGTLLSSQKSLLPSSREVLKRCRQQGIQVFLATARSPMLDKMLGWNREDFALFDGGIYCNGACTKIGNHTEYTYIDPDVVRSCLHIAERHTDIHVGIHLEHELYSFNHFLPDTMLTPWGLDRNAIVPLKEELYSKIVKILIYYDYLVGSTKKLPLELFAQLQDICHERAKIYLTDHGRTIQVMAHSVSKSNAIDTIRYQYGLARDEISVFGDDWNDIEMLSAYPHSVAMGNAIPEVKEIAAYTTKSNDDDGIAWAIQSILSCLKTNDSST